MVPLVHYDYKENNKGLSPCLRRNERGSIHIQQNLIPANGANLQKNGEYFIIILIVKLRYHTGTILTRYTFCLKIEPTTFPHFVSLSPTVFKCLAYAQTRPNSKRTKATLHDVRMYIRK